MARAKHARPSGGAIDARRRKKSDPKRPVPSRKGTTYRAGRATSEAIVQAAQSILIERGFREFTVQSVADKVGISPGNLNYHYPTRSALIAKLIGYTLAQYRHRVRRAGEPINAGTYEALGDTLLWLMSDAAAEPTSRLFRELWAIAIRDGKIATAVDLFYARSVRAHIRRVTHKAKTASNGPDLEAIVYLMHVISEGTTVLFGTRPDSHALLERVRQAAYRAIMHLLVEAPKAAS